MPLEVYNLLYALGLTAFISLSGVMMPGPVFAAAVAKGYEDRLAGIWIAVGHGLVEFPLIAILILGFANLLNIPTVTTVVGVAGGAVLVFLGVSMILRRADGMDTRPMPQHPLTLGVITTVSNPYWLVWWATIGLALILMVYPFALAGLIAFAVVHWSCDLGWTGFVSATVHRTRHFWTEGLRRKIFVAIGGFLVALGAWFTYAGLGGF